MIRTEKITEIQHKMVDAKDAEKLVDVLRIDEPLLYSKLMNYTRATVEEVMQKESRLKPETLLYLHHQMLMQCVFLWTLLKENRDLLVDKIIKLDQFEAFCQGKADDKLYRYKIDGLDPNSTLVKAKLEKQKEDLQALRKIFLPHIAEDYAEGKTSMKTLEKIDGLTTKKARLRRKNSNS